MASFKTASAVVLLLSEVKLKSFVDLDTGAFIFIPVAVVEECPDSGADAGASFGMEGVAVGFAEVVAGAAAGAAGGFSFSLLAPMFSLIVFAGAGSTPAFSRVGFPPIWGLIVGTAGACAGCSRSIGTLSL